MAQKNLITPQQAYEQERATQIAAGSFPLANISQDALNLLHKAMTFNSIHRLRAHFDTHEALVMLNRDFYLPEMYLFLDILRAATPVELGQTLQENLLMLKEVVMPMDEQVAEIIKAIDAPIRLKYEVLMKTQHGVKIGEQGIIGKS